MKTLTHLGRVQHAARAHSLVSEAASQTFSILKMKQERKLPKAVIQNAPRAEQRRNWDKFVADHADTPMFRRRIRMDYASFQKLMCHLRFPLDCQPRQYPHGSIIAPVRLFAVLSWLAGERHTEILDLCGVAKSSFDVILWRTIDAIVEAPKLQLKFPQTEQECLAAARGFQSILQNEAIDTCVCAIDGYHLQIEKPTASENWGDPHVFYSNHYETYGMNIQAACDHQSRFLFIGVGGPGNRDDDVALVECPLGDLIENLPGNFCAMGDCGYQPSEHVIPLFEGKQTDIPAIWRFNHFASQCRDTIETALGRMHWRWPILQKPLRVDPTDVGKLVACIATLHNYSIDEHILKNLPPRSNDTRYYFSPHIQDLRATAAEDKFQRCLSKKGLQMSRNRDRLVARIASKGFKHPCETDDDTSQESTVAPVY